MADYDMGIGLYQVKPDFSEWEELSLPKNDYTNDKPVVKTPCN